MARSAKQVAAQLKAAKASAAARKAKSVIKPTNPNKRIRATWVMNTGTFTGYTTVGEMESLRKWGVDIKPAPKKKKAK
jgi:hypothetical protein